MRVGCSPAPFRMKDTNFDVLLICFVGQRLLRPEPCVDSCSKGIVSQEHALGGPLLVTILAQVAPSASNKEPSKVVSLKAAGLMDGELMRFGKVELMHRGQLLQVKLWTEGVARSPTSDGSTRPSQKRAGAEVQD